MQSMGTRKNLITNYVSVRVASRREAVAFAQRLVERNERHYELRITKAIAYRYFDF